MDSWEVPETHLWKYFQLRIDLCILHTGKTCYCGLCFPPRILSHTYFVAYSLAVVVGL